MAEITMPQLGETVTEGTITRWAKQVGDQVAEDEVLFEVSTDKVDSEVPSPVSGVLTEILVPEGETVDVGTRLAVISDSAAEAPPQAGPAARPEEPVADTAAAGAAAPAPAPAQPAGDLEPASQPAAPEPEAAEAGPPTRPAQAEPAMAGVAASAQAAPPGPAQAGQGLVLSPVVR
ncbi:MAG TPA: biotin/lipoyl-containing protein, partial [Acidimicrobiales bacterium]|nr:biotin/lipoyl-containing protein [Acidimicrobiales bacterium]